MSTIKNTPKRLRVAVVGFGVMGKYHANNYAALPQTDLIAVVDPSEAQRSDAASRYAVPAYETIEELLKHQHIDAASIAAPTSLHYHLARQLLEAGIHVLVEKPAAANIAQAQHLAELSQQQDLVLQVGHITRFYRAVQLLSNQVTNPYLFEARRLTPNSRIKDVGVILDLMIHDIDIVLGLVQSEIQDVSVAGHILNGSPFEDVAAAQITFENGCIARFLASRVAPDAERTLVVAEAEQTYRLDFGMEPHTEIAVYRSLQGETDGNHVQMNRTVVQEDNPLRKELEHFVARINRSAAPIGTLRDDLRCLKLAARLMDGLKPKRSAELVHH